MIAVAAAHPLPEDCATAVMVQGALPYAAAPHLAAAPLAPLAYGAYPAHGAYPIHGAYPAHLSYAAATPVALPPAEVKVPITQTHVEVPVHQRVHYGTQSYVAGATTTIHKPALAAPAIAPPSVLLSKVTHKAPEVTIKTQEVPVERHTPNFVETPYHAGTIVKYNEPEVREYKVPTPVAQPVAVPHPVPVPKAVPVPAPVHSVAVHAAPAVAPVAVAPAVAPLAVAPAAPIAYQAAAVVAVDDC